MVLSRCLSRIHRHVGSRSLPPSLRATHQSRAIDPINLEVFKFGLYIMFPIGWMWYFGTNLENRFSIPDFWPKEGETHKIPFEKDEQRMLAQKLKEARLEKRRRRLEMEEGLVVPEGVVREVAAASEESGSRRRVGGRMEEDRETVEVDQGTERKKLEDRGFGKGVIERWASGK